MAPSHRQPVVRVVPGGRNAGPGHRQTRWADPERRAVLADSAPVPHARLPCPSIVAGSGDDPYRPARPSKAYARAWGSDFVRVNQGGHIDVESSHGPWPLGLALLRTLIERAAAEAVA